MITALIGKIFSAARDGLARALLGLGLKPNPLTVLGLAMMAVAGLSLSRGRFALTVLFILLSCALDMLDGAMARLGSSSSRFGAFLDSSLDRYADIFIFAGLSWHLAYGAGRPAPAIAALAALTGALLVSYTRARAECIVEKCRIGFWARGERLVYVMIGLATGSLAAVTWILAVGTHWTVLGRIFYTRRLCMEPPRPIERGDHLARIFYWDYERGTMPYDIAVVLLAAFAVAAPHFGWR